ncbi:MAG TPA: selenocysteine-specific translation elongation factor [Acidimicrobiales bacterium]|nr:selenocysteine-specific translation elongation factor [Acidimicrobiales bacterium]
MRVIATAGHVDHGKSTLVLALTGMDPDRFAEEKARGLTIDLGFAWTTLPSGTDLAFVDVPGHVRFIKNMLAGVGAVDDCLFVVAATEGWKPQSEEHLRILQLLGVQRGVVALTKSGLVDDDTRELTRMDLADHFSGTFLEDAEMVAVDARTGHGVDNVRVALDRLVAGAPPPADTDRPRLWVDRVFAAKGSGTVVTGTLTRGSLAVDDELVLLPANTPVRVRALQSLQQAHDVILPGSRVAVNLVGVSRADVARGHALVRPGQWHSTRQLDAALNVLPSLDHDVSRRGAYQAYLGSGEYPARLRVLGQDVIKPGEQALVRLHLPEALPLLPGDRFVLRESGRDETVGGGEILDVAPVLAASRAKPSHSVDRVIAERGWIDPGELERLTGERRTANVGRWIVSDGARQTGLDDLGRAVERAGPLGLDLATLSERDRALVPLSEGLAVDNGRLRPAASSDPLADHTFVKALQASPFAPPDADGVDPTELRELVRRGTVVERDGFYFAAEAVDDAGRRVAQLLATHPEGVTVAQLRDALSTTRKHALPLLAILDGTGVTRRRGDVRVPGPRMPGAGAGS